MKAGPTDIMVLEFEEAESVGVGYAVGTSFSKA